MHDTRHNQHQLIKSDNPSDKISNKIQRIKIDSKPIVPLYDTSQGMNQLPYLSRTCDTSQSDQDICHETFLLNSSGVSLHSTLETLTIKDKPNIVSSVS